VEVEEGEEEGVNLTPCRSSSVYVPERHSLSLSLSLLLSQSWNRLDYEIRSKMLDYWLGLGWVGWYCFSSIALYHTSRGRLFMVWFGLVPAFGELYDI